jgi:hypothetical protein
MANVGHRHNNNVLRTCGPDPVNLSSQFNGGLCHVRNRGGWRDKRPTYGTCLSKDIIGTAPKNNQISCTQCGPINKQPINLGR